MSKKINTQFTVGGDPELLLEDSQGQIVSSIPVLKRDKNNPIILDKGLAAKLYADNSLAEMAFKPSKNKKDFVDTYRSVFRAAQKYLGKDYRFRVQSAHFFEQNQLEAAHGIDPQQVGCNPEYDFYKREIKNLGEFESTMRSGSSHIHVGHALFEDIANKENALKVIEIYLGCSSVIWDNDPTSLERRKKYGTSGSFRPTSYGFEMRFMSNYMLNSPKLVELSYDLLEYSLSFMFNGTYEKVIASVNTEDVQKAINKCDKNLALKVLKQAGLDGKLFKRVVSFSEKKYDTKSFYSEWGIKI